MGQIDGPGCVTLAWSPSGCGTLSIWEVAVGGQLQVQVDMVAPGGGPVLISCLEIFKGQQTRTTYPQKRNMFCVSPKYSSGTRSTRARGSAPRGFRRSSIFMWGGRVPDTGLKPGRTAVPLHPGNPQGLREARPGEQAWPCSVPVRKSPFHLAHGVRREEAS